MYLKYFQSKYVKLILADHDNVFAMFVEANVQWLVRQGGHRQSIIKKLHQQTNCPASVFQVLFRVNM